MAASSRRRFGAAILALLVGSYAAAAPTVPVHIVQTDLRPLIRAAMTSPVQFAVLVPFKASTSKDGAWSTAGGHATWRYAVQIPTAVSLSFEAINSSLPPSAMLVVRGAKTTTTYRAKDLHRGSLWSRIHPGDALEFTLTVAAADRGQVALNIAGLQAGYRAIGPGVADHPYYLRLKQQQSGSGNAECVTNYACQVTPSNTPPGAATVAVVIEDLWVCTGVLINDVPGDNTPYVLTARHCETGQLGGGNPGAASTVTVYWDAITPCGEALGSLYDSSIQTQVGAQTLVEQQDAWLIELDANPIVTDAQFAGFDASGGAVQGGYTIHHAEGYDKQFVEWFGQAAIVNESDVLGTTYVSNFLETVNQLGNIAPGASGGGLFDQNNHLVGSLSLGRQTNDPSGYGSCPVPNPPAPDGINGVADFTSLAAIWNSTADFTSSTGNVTIKSILDPANTGTLVVPSSQVANLTFTASTQTISVDQSATLSWTAPNATQCTAGGGVAGDGWSGTLAASGSLSVTEAVASTTTYTLTCTYSGGRTAKASTTVTWVAPNAVVYLTATPATAWATRPTTLTWTSNVAPCSITGGSLSLSNLSSSGTTTTTQATPAVVTYTLSCGSPGQSASDAAQVTYVTPSLVFNANGTDRLLGQTFFLQWSSLADTCTPSGGAPNDGWVNTDFTGSSAASGGAFYPDVTALGTYTYTLACSSGALSVSQSVTVTFEDNSPYVTASLSTSSVTFSASPADYVTVNWNTNLSTCSASSPQFVPIFYSSNPAYAQGSATIEPSESGTYQVVVACFTALNPDSPAITYPPLTLTVLPSPAPTAALSFNPGAVVAGQPFEVAWSSTNAVGCTSSGGIPNTNWNASDVGLPPSGEDPFTGEVGQFTFDLSCGGIDPAQAPATAQATLTIVPGVTLTASGSSVTEGDSFTLTWASDGATSCTASGGGANGSPWSGSVATSGQQTETASVSGTFTYTLVCSAGTLSSAAQQVNVLVSAPASSSSSSGGGSGGGGGGGGLGIIELLMLAASCCAGLPRKLRRAAQIDA
jgi:lysyl endopeptidase